MPATIQKRNKNRYEKHDAGFYKLDPNNKADKKLITEIAEKWGKNSYSYNIYDNLYNRGNCHNAKTYIYVMSDSVMPAKKLSAGSIIGIAELTEKSDIENTLDFIQVKPFVLKTKKYLETGSKMMDIIKCLHFGTPLYVFSDPKARNFYIKNDFKRLPNSRDNYYWMG